MSSEVDAFLAQVTPAKRKRDAQTLLSVYSKATGQEPKLWGTIVGYGLYHYRYPSGRAGETGAAGFAPRKAATTIYLADGVNAHRELVDGLGEHKEGVGCLYIKDLERVDLAVLEEVVARSYRTLTNGTYTKRAREGGRPHV